MKKILITIVATVMVCACIVGGTVAWLVDSTDSIKNTFTVGDVSITLTETTGDGSNDEYKLIPGGSLEKDPKVTVGSDSEDCWVFVKIKKSDNFDSFAEFDIGSDWQALTGVEGVYYSKQKATAGQVLPILLNNQVDVKESVTKEMVTADDFVNPTLEFTAYAIQYSGFEDDANIKTAWDAIQDDINS